MFHGRSSDSNLQHLYFDFNTVAVTLHYNVILNVLQFQSAFAVHMLVY